MPAKSTRPSDTVKSPPAAARKRPAARRTSAKQPQPDHGAIAERAYFIHVDEGSYDQLANWLRAERELTAV